MTVLRPAPARPASGLLRSSFAAPARLGLALGLAALFGAATAAPPDFGPNVILLDPSMPLAQIQSTVDQIAAQQVPNQFGPERYAILFKPGVYGSADTPLNFQVGYYTSVAGLGLQPDDAVVNGSINVYNQCDANGCIALNNFWRSLSNLSINVANGSLGCYFGEFWAVSQAAPMRRVHVNGQATLMDYCTGPSFASGGFIADSRFDGSTVINGSQQQWLVRNSILDGWTNGVWNQVFSGVVNAPAECFPGSSDCGGGPYTTLPTSPITREAPFLYLDSGGNYRVFVPGVLRNSVGTSWDTGTAKGKSLGIDTFYIAHPGDGARQINRALAQGMNLLLTPGVYALDAPIIVPRASTVILGLGFPTLVPSNGNAAMIIKGDGVKLAGVLVDAGPVNSPVLLSVGGHGIHHGKRQDPTTLSDVFLRVGGATPGKASKALVVNSDGAILDDVWAWRADHGNGVGWTQNTAAHGLVVRGDAVTAYGLFVEHFQKQETLWDGDDGTVVFYQNEMPYDPPSQADWMERANFLGYPALRVNKRVLNFHGYGMGSYSFFNQHVDVFASSAFEVPDTLPKGSLHDLLTIFLDATNGAGGILNVVNDAGGSSTIANPDVPVTVQNYP